MNATISFSGTPEEVKAITDIIGREKRAKAAKVRANLVSGSFVLIKRGEPGYDSAVYEVALFDRDGAGPSNEQRSWGRMATL